MLQLFCCWCQSHIRKTESRVVAEPTAVEEEVMANDTSHFLWLAIRWLMLDPVFHFLICMYVLCLPDVSVRTVWTSWWAQGPLTSWKMLIPGAATCATRHSATETSNSDQTGELRFKTSLSTTAPWSLYVPHLTFMSCSHGFNSHQLYTWLQIQRLHQLK